MLDPKKPRAPTFPGQAEPWVDRFSSRFGSRLLCPRDPSRGRIDNGRVEVLLMGEHLHMLTQGRVEQNGLKSRSRRCVGLAGYLGHPYAR